MDEEQADETTQDEGGVLSPDELDITVEDNVVELEEGRFVISPRGDQPNVPASVDGTPADLHGTDEDRSRSPDLSDDVVHEWLAERLGETESKYAFDVTACFEDRVTQRELFSNDVVTTFENLVVWYANHVGSDTPVEDVLGILLLESNLSVRFPADSLEAFGAANGLDETDSVGALYTAARDAGGIRFPPRDG